MLSINVLHRYSGSIQYPIFSSSIKSDLNSCIDDISMGQIKVSASQRARAIDIYENLNRGGVCLNTFDLIMARVAKVSSENFYTRPRRPIKSI